jgi:hypothetical protein
MTWACVVVALPGPSACADDGVLSGFSWRSIGPGSASGRIVDVESLDTDPRFVLVASASGGVWKSENGGTTFKAIFDRYATGSIGDVAVHQRDPRLIWVGTGEANNRNDVGWGDGIYKSTDGGATFVNVGLTDTFQIARVLLHPTDPNIVYVAAVGDLWGDKGDRGLFKTVDGGRTWQKLGNGLPAGRKAGATDIVMDPSNRTSFTSRSTSGCGGPTGSTPAGRTAGCSSRPMRERRGAGWPGAFPPATSGASVSPSRGGTRAW